MYPCITAPAGGQAVRLIVKPDTVAHGTVLASQEQLLAVAAAVLLLLGFCCFLWFQGFATARTARR